MTKDDFDKIIQTSREHLTKQTYFEAQRVAFKCLPQEYGRELIVAFKRFNDAIPIHTFKEMLHHVSRNIRFPLQTMSNLPWDNRKYYEFDYHSFFCDSDGRKFFPDELGDEMDNLWRELNAYVQSIDPGTTTPNSTNIQQEQSLLKYLLHPQREELANELKNSFSTEKGKSIRLMITVLQDRNPKILSIGNRQKKEFHTALQKFFNRNIGTYQSVFDCYIDEKTDQIALQNIKSKIDFILESISLQK